jgi:uncharacterized membrane protein
MTHENPNARLETFCDGVFAIALTLLVLEIKSPVAEQIHTSDDLWQALRHLVPSVLAFLLSFGTIMISWVNHHAFMKLVHKSGSLFIYATGFLLLTIVLLPFPTALLAEFALTDAATPAVVAYSFVLTLQGLAWILLGSAALRPNHLMKSEAALASGKESLRQAYIGLAVYLTCTILAFWFPLAIAIAIGAIFVFWLIFGIRQLKAAE